MPARGGQRARLYTSLQTANQGCFHAWSLSDLGRIYCGDVKQVHLFDPFRYVEPLCASNDRITVLRFPLASLRTLKSDRLLVEGNGEFVWVATEEKYGSQVSGIRKTDR